MSMESFRNFWERVEKDQHFALQASKFKQADDLVQFARAAGFDFSVEEFIEANKVFDEKPSKVLEEIVHASFDEFLAIKYKP